MVLFFEFKPLDVVLSHQRVARSADDSTFRRRQHARQGKPGAFADIRRAALAKSRALATLRFTKLPI